MPTGVMLLTCWQAYGYLQKIIRRKDYTKGRKWEGNYQTTSKEREEKSKEKRGKKT